MKEIDLLIKKMDYKKQDYNGKRFLTIARIFARVI